MQTAGTLTADGPRDQARTIASPPRPVIDSRSEPRRVRLEEGGPREQNQRPDDGLRPGGVPPGVAVGDGGGSVDHHRLARPRDGRPAPPRGVFPSRPTGPCSSPRTTGEADSPPSPAGLRMTTGSAESPSRTSRRSSASPTRTVSARTSSATSTGPGAVVRLWSARIGGSLRVFLDGSPEPLYDGPAEVFFQRTYEVLGSPANASLFDETYSQAEAGYYPIPFATASPRWSGWATRRSSTSTRSRCAGTSPGRA